MSLSSGNNQTHTDTHPGIQTNERTCQRRQLLSMEQDEMISVERTCNQ